MKPRSVMRLVISSVLIALGAALRFALSVASRGLAIHTAGVILLILGSVGLVSSVLRMTFWRDRGRSVAVIERPEAPLYRAIKS
jgi:hypothetical protein